MVTIAIVGVLLGLAAPALRDFVARNKVAGISNEFTGAMLTARSEAIRLNSCVSMCVSTSVLDAKPACDAKETDWQKGWLMFVNKDCADTTPEAAADILKAHGADEAAYTMNSSASRTLITFTPQGRASGSNETFELRYAGDTELRYGRNIVLSSQGRTNIQAAK